MDLFNRNVRRRWWIQNLVLIHIILFTTESTGPSSAYHSPVPCWLEASLGKFRNRASLSRQSTRSIFWRQRWATSESSTCSLQLTWVKLSRAWHDWELHGMLVTFWLSFSASSSPRVDLKGVRDCLHETADWLNCYKIRWCETGAWTFEAFARREECHFLYTVVKWTFWGSKNGTYIDVGLVQFLFIKLRYMYR